VGQIDALGRCVRLAQSHDVGFAQDRDLAIDGQACALVVVSHHAIAQHDPFVGLEFDFQGHV
jgi:hypothetical protein